MSRSGAFFLVFASLMLGLSACTSSTGSPGGGEPVPVETASGNLGEELAGMMLATLVGQSPDVLTLGPATVGEDGNFELELPETVPAENLRPASEVFPCGDLPEFNLAMFSSLTVLDGESVQGLAFMVPTGTEAEDGQPETFVQFVYSDRNVDVNVECNREYVPEGLGDLDTASINVNMQVYLSLVLGWNAVIYTHRFDELTYEEELIMRTAPVLAYFWLFYLMSQL